MKIAALAAAVVVAGAAVGSAHADVVVDQEQPTIVATVGGFAVGGFYDSRISQVFTPGLNGQLVAVALPIACDSSSVLLVEIQGVTTGKPNGTVYSHLAVPGSHIPFFYPSPPVLRRIELPVPVAQRSGVPLAIVLDSPGDCGIFQGPVGDSYAGGNLFGDSRPNPVGVWICNCEFAGASWDIPFRTFVEVDSTPPRITVPHDMIVDAVGPSGAVVSYTATATDETDPDPRVTCLPPSGSTFAIGVTVVTCTATDAGGNSAAVRFAVTVRGASEQITRLRERVAALEHPGIASSLAAKLDGGGCGRLRAFASEAKAQAGKHIDVEVAGLLAGDAARISDVLDC